MKTKNLRHKLALNAPPSAVYELLANAKKHSKLTGGKTIISKKINGKFSIFDGYIHGYNIELVKGKKIVQAWHFAEDGWPDDHFSICTFDFKKGVNGTILTFTQTGIPSHKYKELQKGWQTYYWIPMQKMLEG